MNVAELTRKIESRFPVGESTNYAISITGEAYVVIGHQKGEPPFIPGTVDEGMAREFGFDEESCCKSALDAFERYAEHVIAKMADPKAAVLYWRIKPEYDCFLHGTPPPPLNCGVYMRLLLSDKPPRSEYREPPPRRGGSHGAPPPRTPATQG